MSGIPGLEQEEAKMREATVKMLAATDELAAALGLTEALAELRAEAAEFVPGTGMSVQPLLDYMHVVQAAVQG